MIKILLKIFILILVVTGCNSSQELPDIEYTPLQGELTFKIRSINALPETVIKELDSLEKVGNLDPFQKKALNIQRTIEKYNLNEMPSFYIKTDSTSIFKAYTTEKNFEKIKEYKLENLVRELKKVNLKIEGSVMENLIICKEITEVEVVEGKTIWQR